MYAGIEKNRLHISVAKFYSSEWYNKEWPLSGKEKFDFESKPTFIPVNGFLKIAAKLLIPLQAALFALALRNRFRR